MGHWEDNELERSRFWDVRVRKSFAVMLANLYARPDLSFSSAVGNAKRQAFTRACKWRTEGDSEMPELTLEDLMEGHYHATMARAEEESRGGLLLLAQDTTHFNFNGLLKTSGLGYGNAVTDRCLFGHSCLVMTADGLPLGVAHLDIWARDPATHGKRSERRKLEIEDKESYRWINTIKSVEGRLPEGQPVLFIQDREADIFALLEAKRRPTTSLLIRAAHPRNVEVNIPGQDAPVKGNLFSAAANAPVVSRMQVSIPRLVNQPPKPVDFIVQATALKIMPPWGQKQASSEPVSVWVVRAREETPPENEKALEWVLVTTMPITDGDHAAQMIRYYSKRWTIERLHYVMKSGGSRSEELRMDDAHSLKLALSMYYITGWRLLYISHFARLKPDAPASTVLADDEIEVLELLERAPIKTIADSVIAIAKLGGYEHYKNAPPPGVKRLWIGIRRLADIALGRALALQEQAFTTGLRYDT